MHQFDASQDTFGGSKSLEIQHRFDDLLHCPIVLFEDVVELLHLQHDERCFASGIDLIHGCLVGPALVHGVVEIFPDTTDLDLSFVHAPAAARWAFMFVKDFFKQSKNLDRPPVQEEMCDHYTTLLHDFFQVRIAERIGQVPAGCTPG
jgi:hypothetical protein